MLNTSASKSGLCSSRNEQVMLNFVIWRGRPNQYNFCQKKNQTIVTLIMDVTLYQIGYASMLLGHASTLLGHSECQIIWIVYSTLLIWYPTLVICKKCILPYLYSFLTKKWPFWRDLILCMTYFQLFDNWDQYRPILVK